MLRWIIGVWLASGAVLPAFWLLSMAYRLLAASKIGPKGLCALSGLVGIGIGALILLFVCSFSDAIITTRDMPSAFAVAQAPMTHVAEARPIQLLPSVTLSLSPAQFSAAQAGPPLFGEAEHVASILPRIDDVGQSAGDDASHQTDAAVPQALLTAPLHAKPGMKRGLAHRYAPGPSVGPSIAHSSSSGLWLFAPNGNEGAND